MKRLALIFLLIGVFLLLFSANGIFTGAFIGADIKISNTPLLFFSLVFFIASAVLYLSHKSLEAIVIPIGPDSKTDKKRLDTAMGSYSGDNSLVLVTGVIHRDERERPLKSTQQYSIYKELRERYGLTPKEMIIEGKSRDTLENFLYSIDRLKKKRVDRIKIVTNPTQYWRFKLFEKEAKKEGLIEDSFKIEPLYTSETLGEYFYGILAYIKDYFRVKSAGSLEKAAGKKRPKLGNLLKRDQTH